MSQSEQKVVQYLNEAHASELGLAQVLQAQIAMTPNGSYRNALEKHLGETRDHARRIDRRVADLGPGWQPVPDRDGLGGGRAGADVRIGQDAV